MPTQSLKDSGWIEVICGSMFSGKTEELIRRLRRANKRKRVIVAGLDKDFRGKPFDPIPKLLAEAEYITKTLAICVLCGSPAGFSQRLSTDRTQILLGEKGNYEARCRKCFIPPQN